MKNIGDATASNAVLEWNLPDGFEITDGDSSVSIGDILPGDESTHEISIHSSTSTGRGINEIRVTLAYE